MTRRIFVLILALVALASGAVASDNPSAAVAKYRIENIIDGHLVKMMVEASMREASFEVDGAGGPYARAVVSIGSKENSRAGYSVAMESASDIVEYLAATNPKGDLSIVVRVVKGSLNAEIGRAQYDRETDEVKWIHTSLWYLKLPPPFKDAPDARPGRLFIPLSLFTTLPTPVVT